ncbi:MAG: O-antigen ligase family protein [Verrucomicrobiales bacterium]|nr:O-antigen ligase family protein [Verrucomicrobiales bacterium]MCP5526522.1 O-antigen ligase family protein [Verrucomicrobiales bacterium]
MKRRASKSRPSAATPPPPPPPRGNEPGPDAAASPVGKPAGSGPPTPPRSWLNQAALGALLGLAVAKFGNPALLDRYTTAPGSFYEYLFFAWPLRWGYGALFLATLVCLFRARWRPEAPRWLLALPAVWFGWQLLAASGTVDAALTRVTLPYLGSVALCYYVGLAALGGEREGRVFWLCYLVGFGFMLATGFEQHFGGLAAARDQILARPDRDLLPPEYLERVNKMRVFATLLYPNALAGVLLLMLPAVSVGAWRLLGFLTPPSRVLLGGALAAAGLACLYWSKSKAGWLVALLMGTVLFWRLPFARRWKIGFSTLLLVAGLAAFFVRFADYFERGATSVGARFDYWRAAAQTVRDHPVLGAGPGAFAREYRQRKTPEAEMARLAHNDYLQQACDSGLPGAFAYAAFVWGGLGLLARRCWRDPLHFAMWLGLLGWGLQSAAEFGLYIPPIGWAAFLMFGWLSGLPNPPPRRAAGSPGPAESSENGGQVTPAPAA